MINEFRHLEEGYTVIYCPDSATKHVKEVYIETEDFSKVDMAIEGHGKVGKGIRKSI